MIKDGYIIRGGAEGKKRLDVLSGILQSTTRTLLEAHGLAPGSSLLDVGCGGGNVSLMAAQITGVQGKITGIDFDKSIIELNKRDAEIHGVKNISYYAMDATAIDFDSEFDMAYSRFLLSHLTSPVSVIRKMIAAVKPGGTIIIEDIDFSGHFCYPSNKAFDEYVRLFTATAVQRGQDPNIGPALFSLLREAGAAHTGFDVIQPAFDKGEGKRMAVITMEKIRDAVVAEGFADDAEVNAVISGLDAFTADENTIISLPRIVRVWGTRPA